MRKLMAHTLTVAIAVAGFALAAPAEASAFSCAEEYLVCLNDNVYGGGGSGVDELDSVECGARYVSCLMRIF